MSDNNIPRLVLSGNHSMPVIGLGTFVFQKPGELTKTAVIEAIEVGYRHFDTASLYGTEQALGEAIEEALKLGLIVSRDELFITSKLWMSDAHPDRVLPALQKSLGLLKLEYLDLYLIHLPVSLKPESDTIFPTKENMAPCYYYSFCESSRNEPYMSTKGVKRILQTKGYTYNGSFSSGSSRYKTRRQSDPGQMKYSLILLNLMAKQLLRISSSSLFLIEQDQNRWRLLYLKLGYSHEVELMVPPATQVFYFKNNVVCCTGIDTQRVHQFAATVRSCKLPEVYKGKGILYIIEVIKKKQGKKSK
ncbi:hypothetical protein K1719_037105 [Acacia pycnantha]|nr:hypothetical protein K1719_037105 [Acacia pycnantha]